MTFFHFGLAQNSAYGSAGITMTFEYRGAEAAIFKLLIVNDHTIRGISRYH
jgi:hypothetical protein